MARKRLPPDDPREWLNGRIWPRFRKNHLLPLPLLKLSGCQRFFLIGKPWNRAFRGADCGAGDRFDLLLGLGGAQHPVAVELIGAFGHAFVAVAGVEQAGVAAMEQLEEVIL